MTKPSLSEWQRQVVTELAVIAEAFPDDLEALGSYRLDKTGSLRVPLRLTTGDIPRVVGGLPIGEHEEFDVTVGRSDLAPPRVEVDHTRFLHHAHVLQGQRLCLYMDPSREWDPLRGFGGFLDRLVDWLGVAAAGRFDAQTALYHAVGGVLHAADGAPTVVVRDAPAPGERAQHGWLVARTPSRFDLSLERSGDPENDGTEAEHVPVVMLDADLPFGAGTCLASFLVTVDDPYLGHPAPDQTGLGRRPAATGMSAVIPTVLGASAIRKPEGTPQRFIVSVPHPTGGPPTWWPPASPLSGPITSVHL